MNAKEESELLLNDVLPLAERMLREHGEFYPYAGYMKPDGELVAVGAALEGTHHPASRDLIDTLRNSLRDLARSKKCKAVAIVFDVAVTLPNSDRRSDAIQVSLDHVSGYSVDIFFPYQIVNANIVYAEKFAQQGSHEVFGEA
jgi:hypothetical protein